MGRRHELSLRTQARGCRQGLLGGRVPTCHLQKIAAIDPCAGYLNYQLIGDRLIDGALGYDEAFADYGQCLHVSPLLIRRARGGARRQSAQRSVS